MARTSFMINDARSAYSIHHTINWPLCMRDWCVRVCSVCCVLAAAAHKRICLTSEAKHKAKTLEKAEQNIIYANLLIV